MKRIAALIFIFLGVSCNFFEGKVPDEDELLQEQLARINWNEVSAYPSIAECGPILDKEEKKECFFETMARIIQEKLSADTLAVLYPEADTIDVEVTVFSDASLKFEPMFPADSTAYNTKAIDSLIKARLTGFPEIEPAQKEGVPVTTQFILPVIINVQ
ncbi:hypothetical protein [Flavobacterium sp. MK4S-17]|jgi:hypothetical protein|uniref:hypothetical protein n=1 Tax=Flavobacterium sp. MK4S-17 TaxID=2543737 RepID=UPI00135A0EDC|nr:hypothetical protein [Flavobacterium sp. MK4S-17]